MNRRGVEHRQRWLDRQSWAGGRRRGLKRVDRQTVGPWPEVYERADGARIVTARYFKPGRDQRTHLVALLVAIGAMYCAYAIAPRVWAEKEWTLFVGAAVIGYWAGRLLGYRLTASRVVVTFLPDGTVTGPGFTIPPHDNRAFALLGPSADPRAQWEKEHEETIRARKGPNWGFQPRHYRDACQVVAHYGPGSMHRPVVADLGCDAFQTMAGKLRSVLEQAERATGGQTAARRGTVLVVAGTGG